MCGTMLRQLRIFFPNLSEVYEKPSLGITKTMKDINSVERRFRYAG